MADEPEDMKKSAVGHLPFPDYSRPVFQVPEDNRSRILDKLTRIYGQAQGRAAYTEIERLMRVYYAHKRPEQIAAEKSCHPEARFSEKDIILITYGDMIQGENRAPLAQLCRFAETYLSDTFNTIHILPFFPYSSDRGFAVTDFESVDPRLGTWADIEKLEEKYQLMFDGVVNHVSSQSRWFREFLNCDRYYKDFFITFDSPE